ncbi:MAG: DUF2264 domain-containing protein [Specibacter sp.]
MELPAPDTQRSPVTGWTRDHWLAFANAQLQAVRPFASDDLARIQLPGRASSAGEISDGLEGFARTFLLAAFLTTGEQGADPHGHLGRYRQGLLAGTAGAWPPITSRSQPLVEAASIALALHLTRPWLWDTLAPNEQDQVAAWLSGASTSEVNRNNWVLFPLVIAEFLAGVGRRHNAGQIEHGLASLEEWYVGGGWYRDGDGDYFDYYCGWAMHLYPLLWLRMLAERDPARAAALRSRYAGRLAEFLPDHVGFFGGNGSPVYHGRSLIYRYAAAAPLFMAELAGVPSPLSPGQLRRVASGAAQFFADGGAYPAAGPAAGLPTLGWQGEFLPLTQSYSGPASPFWTSKAFVGLLLPADHPVWTAVEEPTPVELADRTSIAPGPNFLTHSTASDGIARVLNHGSDKYYGPGSENTEYSRLAYSSHTAPVYDPRGPLDNHIGLLDSEGTPSTRMRIHRIAADGGTVASFHHPVWGKQDEAASPWRIATATTAGGGYELRLHVVGASSNADGAAHSGEPIKVREGGYAVAGDEPVATAVAPAGSPDAAGATAFREGLHSTIWPLAGYAAAGGLSQSGFSPLGEHSSVPYLAGVHAGGISIFASLVQLSAHAPATAPTDIVVHDDGDTVSVSVTCPDGRTLRTALALR